MAKNATAARGMMRLRLPPDLKRWLQAQAKKNCTSMNAEMVRAATERRERVEAQQ